MPKGGKKKTKKTRKNDTFRIERVDREIPGAIGLKLHNDALRKIQEEKERAELFKRAIIVDQAASQGMENAVGEMYDEAVGDLAKEQAAAAAQADMERIAERTRELARERERKKAAKGGNRERKKPAKEGIREAKSKQAGILFPPTRIRRMMRKHMTKFRITENAAVYTAAVLQDLVNELIDIAGNNTRERKMKRIVPGDIYTVIASDADFIKLIPRPIIPQSPYVGEFLYRQPSKNDE